VTSSITWRFDSPYGVFFIGAPLEPSPYLQSLPRYLAPNISGSRPWPFGVMWPFDASYTISYRRSIVTDSLSSAVFEMWGLKHIGVTTLTFWGHVTSLVMWPFDAPYSISYRRSIVTDSLCPAVSEILGPKHIEVTTLTFQGHVTSSIAWRFDSPYRISYWCSIGTKALSPSAFEIFGSKVPV